VPLAKTTRHPMLPRWQSSERHNKSNAKHIKKP